MIKLIQALKISFTMILILWGTLMAEQSPHKNLKLACTECHSSDVLSWKQINFEHGQTGFELFGVHKKVPCKNCHDISKFETANPRCIYCHVDYHTARLSQDCEICHSPLSWNLFDIYKVHAQTTFQIQGVHARLDCWQCHRGETEGQFLIQRSSCIDCHRQNYLDTKMPNHLGLGFSRRCNDCHSFISWKPAFFKEHDSYFPISSGTHSGEWEQCSDCHQGVNNYTDFSCLNCHEHSKGKMDDKHRERRDYVYESQACYRCHPQGRGE